MTITDVGLQDAMKTHLAGGHNRRNQRAENWKFDVLAGCGRIDSTIEDMLRYLKANMDGEGTLGRAFRLAQQPQRDVNSTERIGLAWMTRAATPDDVIWHNGTTLRVRQFHRHGKPQTRSGHPDKHFRERRRSRVRRTVECPLHSYKFTPLGADALSAYPGVYKLAGGGLIKVLLRDDQVYAQALGEEGILLFPSKVDEFFTRIDGFHLIFRRNDDGQVSTLVLRQTGDRVATKLSGDEATAALSKF